MVDTYIYAIVGDSLKRYLDQDGVQNIGTGVVIAETGWSQYTTVFTGVVGEIFAISSQDFGSLWRFVDTGGSTLGPGTEIGIGGWNQNQSVFYGGNNAIYAITSSGLLFLYTVNGNANIGGGVLIGNGGWQNVSVIH